MLWNSKLNDSVFGEREMGIERFHSRNWLDRKRISLFEYPIFHLFFFWFSIETRKWKGMRMFVVNDFKCAKLECEKLK